MPSPTHARLCFTLALCLVLSLFFLYNDRFGQHTQQPYNKTSTVKHKSIYNSTLGFEEILAINAPWRTDRKDSLTLATAESGIVFQWVEGINATNMDERAYPQGNHRPLPRGNLGSWRAHMNAIRSVIERNLTTALILEDDIDWDSRLRDQLSFFGLASKRLSGMIQQAERAGKPQVPSTESVNRDQTKFDPIELAKRFTLPLTTFTHEPSAMPYGLDWDVLWLGHCGASLPPHNVATPPPFSRREDRLMLLNDSTVPDINQLKLHHASSKNDLASIYPTHTRVYHRSHRTLCTLAYAVTQAGARKILYEHGIRNFNKGFDFALSEWCDGDTKDMGARPMCLTSSPPLFSHFWPQKGQAGGGKGDITGIGGDGLVRGTSYVVTSVRGGLEELVEGSEM